MSGNSFGKILKITTFGESHGSAIGCILDGLPSLINVNEDIIRFEMNRRKPGQSAITTDRKESDCPKILSGVFEGKSTGAPICILIDNADQRSKDYDNIKDIFRPSHADYSYFMKYNIRDHKGGGRSSARETAARVAAGAIVQEYLKQKGIVCLSFVEQIYNIKADIKIDHNFVSNITKDKIDSNIVRCPNALVAEKMIDLIKEVKSDGDSIGGIITCVIKGVPAGLGSPVFDKLQADLAKAMLSINAVKGFEIGSGFDSVLHKGSQLNDSFCNDGQISTKTNNSGGILGGISTGNFIYFKVAFKPTATILKKQNTVDINGKEIELQMNGRHDPCVLPRAVPIVDAMAALVVADHYLLNKSIC
jgi:chorismate synthase